MPLTEILASHPSDLRRTVHIALDEMLKALEECCRGLTHQQLWFDGLENRNRIGSILLHVQQNIDCHACWFQVGEWALAHDPRFDFYGKPALRFSEGDDLPPAETLIERHRRLREKVFAGLAAAASDAELFTPRAAENQYWWQQHRRTSIDGYLRVVGHANAHIRQIWLMRGAMGARGPEAFPQQFYH